MKRPKLIISSIIIFVACIFIAPSFLNADPAPMFNSGNGHYYEVIQDFLNWTDANTAAQLMEYKGYRGHLSTITSQEENDFIYTNFSSNYNSSLWIGGQQIGGPEPDGGWEWVTGEIWSYTNWNSGEPNDLYGAENSLVVTNSGYWNDMHVGGGDSPFFRYLVEYDLPLESESVPEPEVWVRTIPMTCWQVWINEDNNFQFIFWYPYRDNNWVKIYDMSGKEVFSIDMPYGNPNLIVDLPDGMYTVKTFTVGSAEPIQTFVIGKP